MTSIPIGLIAGLILAPMILTCFAVAFIAHKYVDSIEERLPNCSFIKTTRDAFSAGGLVGKVMRGGVIAMVLMMPELSARRGVIDAKEVKNLPRHYKYLLITPAIILFVLFFSLIALRVSTYFIGSH
ncbi:hypothetical protein J3D47_002849 [Pseudomonas laurylsulfativorans]|uniref:hypothetical protein n=1 Tax=Pseudomonas laurylsulfativorans TaxID=1943631 RepID=UPI00209F8E4D|nr:hypothetical protein [Pseudomonas laurylsulfativorans]MCP1418606.1 hypothetical protein [Pseudomonas laurylsulfativorans]